MFCELAKHICSLEARGTAPLWAKMIDSDGSCFLVSHISPGHLEPLTSLGPLTPSQPKEIVFLSYAASEVLLGDSSLYPESNSISSPKGAC